MKIIVEEMFVREIHKVKLRLFLDQAGQGESRQEELKTPVQ